MGWKYISHSYIFREIKTTVAATMSAELCWSIIRKNSCFLLKNNGLQLTKEPNNLAGVNTFKHNGLVNKKTVGVDAAADGKGVVLSLRRAKGASKPSKATTSKSSRHAIKTIKNTLEKASYRKDLVDPATRRACAILRSQKTASSIKKNRSRRKKL